MIQGLARYTLYRLMGWKKNVTVDNKNKKISIFERIIPPIFSFFSTFLSGKIITKIEIRLKVYIFIRCLISGVF